jgi:hypothetical protein
MALAETQQLRMLERLASAGEQPVTLDRLRASGIDSPAVVIGELELNGYVIERVYEHGRQLGVRLLETDAADPPPHAGAVDGAEFRDSHRRSETSCCAQRTGGMGGQPRRPGPSAVARHKGARVSASLQRLYAGDQSSMYGPDAPSGASF